jgi:hypothetical protein
VRGVVDAVDVSPPDGHETFSEFGRMVVISDAKLKVIDNTGLPQ